MENQFNSIAPALSAKSNHSIGLTQWQSQKVATTSQIVEGENSSCFFQLKKKRISLLKEQIASVEPLVEQAN